MTSPEPPGAHDLQHGAGDVHRAEEVGLDLCTEVFGGDLLEEPGVEVAGVVDRHIYAAEAVDGGFNRGLGVGRVGHVQLHDRQVREFSDRLGHLVSIATRSDNLVAGSQSSLSDVDAHTAPRARNKPDLAHICTPCPVT